MSETQFGIGMLLVGILWGFLIACVVAFVVTGRRPR